MGRFKPTREELHSPAEPVYGGRHHKRAFDHKLLFCDVLLVMATLEDITKQAIHLPPRQRIALAGFLLEMDPASSDPTAEEAWETEIQARIRAVDSGQTVGVPYEDVMSQAESRLAR